MQKNYKLVQGNRSEQSKVELVTAKLRRANNKALNTLDQAEIVESWKRKMLTASKLMKKGNQQGTE